MHVHLRSTLSRQIRGCMHLDTVEMDEAEYNCFKSSREHLIESIQFVPALI